MTKWKLLFTICVWVSGRSGCGVTLWHLQLYPCGRLIITVTLFASLTSLWSSCNDFFQLRKFKTAVLLSKIGPCWQSLNHYWHIANRWWKEPFWTMCKIINVFNEQNIRIHFKTGITESSDIYDPHKIKNYLLKPDCSNWKKGLFLFHYLLPLCQQVTWYHLFKQWNAWF